jgi:tetratricopeptide (TPR) repeat protein
MRQWNSRRPLDGLKRAMVSLFLLGPVPSAVVHAGDDPPAATPDAARPRFTLGSEVVLKLPGLPIFDQGREVPSGENLTFMVERSEAGRLLLVSRDQKTRGWAYEDEVVPFEHAADYVGRAVLNDVRDAESFWVLGRLWFYLNDVDRALVNLNRAIRLPNSQPAFYLSRSLVHMRRKDLRRALDDCDTVLRLEPDRAQARLVREQVELAKRDYGAAMAALEQAFRFDPANPYSRGSGPVRAASARELLGLHEGDTKDDKKPAESRPERRTAAECVASGDTWYSRQEFDKAIDDYNAALKLDPRYAPAYTSRARAWMLKHYRDREIADYDAAIKLEPGNAMFRVARAEAWSARGMHEAAMADYAEALRLAPNNPAIWVSRGHEWRKDLKVDTAIADFNQAIRLDPAFAPAYVARGNVWKQIGRFDLAIQGFSDLVRLNPQDPVAHQMLARILATAHLEQSRNGKWALDEATRACELAHWIDPDALDTLAAASAEIGDFESAVRWQGLAIKLIRQRFPSALQKKAISMGGGRGAGVGFEDRLAFYMSKKPIRE